MIATVRIAPVERWCFRPLSTAHAGLEIQIYTDGVEVRHCQYADGLGPARHWRLTRKSEEDIARTAHDEYYLEWMAERPIGSEEGRICEHMLEMD